MKICKECLSKLDESMFSKRNSVCKECRNKKAKIKYLMDYKYRESQKERSRYRLEDKREEILKYQKIYYNNNKDKVIDRIHTYRINNLSIIKENKKKYYEKNKNIILEKCSVYYYKNRGTDEFKLNRRIHSHKRSHKIYLMNDGTITIDSINQLYIHQDGRCAISGDMLNGIYHIDHINPISKGGPHTISNIQLLCPKVNMMKGNKHPFYFGGKTPNNVV